MIRSGELARLRAVQERAMVDTCEILEPDGSTDSYNLPAENYPASGTPSSCGFRPQSRREVQQSGQVIVADAELRLPVSTTISRVARVKITARHGVALASPPTYEVIGDPARGPSGLLVTLRRVESG